LPDGIFFKPKFQCGLILEGLAKEDVCMFYGHWVYLRTSGIFRGH
jgi:hypothetical protein